MIDSFVRCHQRRQNPPPGKQQKFLMIAGMIIRSRTMVIHLQLKMTGWMSMKRRSGHINLYPLALQQNIMPVQEAMDDLDRLRMSLKHQQNAISPKINT